MGKANFLALPIYIENRVMPTKPPPEIKLTHFKMGSCLRILNSIVIPFGFLDFKKFIICAKF